MRNVNVDEVALKNITESIHIDMLSRMKTCLDRYEGFCRLEGGGDSKLFRLLKKELMDVVYDGENNVFDLLRQLKIVEPCLCNSSVRSGYNDRCQECRGSGYVFTTDFAEQWLEQM